MPELTTPSDNASGVQSLQNDDLRKNHNYYDIATLEQNIMNLGLKVILYTQTLTSDFCVKYILSETYASCDSERYLCDGDVLCHQKHITSKDLHESWIKYNNNEL